ncbi:MAG: VWA domain-containing protein, partial [Planctomycetota bacterium]
MANVISNDSTATSAAATSPSSASIYCPTSGPGQGPEPHSTPQHHPIDSNRDVDAWDEEELEDDPFFSSEITAMIGSTLVHLIIILSLALVPLHLAQEESAVVIVSEPSSLEDEIPVIDQITFSDTPDNRIGADSVAELEMSQASAENFAEVAEIPNPIDLEPVDMGKIMVNQIFTEPVAPMQRLTNQRGRTGEGTQGAAGAVDRITFELLQTMEENPTLVTWLFDQSGSLLRQRTEIRERFDRIYEELGIIQEPRSDLEQRVDTEVPAKDQPLLTAVMGFGESVEFYTDKPTAKLDEIKAAVDSISVDSSGTERVFTAIETAVDKYKNFRRDRGELGQRRSVVFVVVTDERGDDADRLEEAISACRKWGIPVYVIGVPAPFGREHTLVKYVDPDPKYDQSPQWAQVDQGPESLVPERVQVGFTADFRAERAIDSGFGPYALTRLCYETSGIYFTVHPNRNTNRRVWRNEIDPFSSNLTHFFDPQLMRRYQPDYLAPRDYFSQVKASPLRQALVSAAQLPPV